MTFTIEPDGFHTASTAGGHLVLVLDTLQHPWRLSVLVSDTWLGTDRDPIKAIAHLVPAEAMGGFDFFAGDGCEEWRTTITNPELINLGSN